MLLFKPRVENVDICDFYVTLIFVVARTPNARKPVEQTNGAAEAEITPASTPRTQDRTYTDDEMLRFVV
jgi:hypothetical protein